MTGRRNRKRRQEIMAAVATIEGGALIGQIRAVLGDAYSAPALTTTMAQMVNAGLLHVWHAPMRNRYFLSAEARDAAADRLAREHIEYRKAMSFARREKKRAHERVRSQEMRDAAKASKAVALPKGKPAGVWVAPRPKAAPEIVIREGLQIQVCPGYTGDRWNVQPPEVGFASMGVGRYLDAA